MLRLDHALPMAAQDLGDLRVERYHPPLPCLGGGDLLPLPVAARDPDAQLDLTYDSYFTKDAAYPLTLGLTMGILPWDRLQLEVGFDLLLPSDNPLLLNAKLGTPEDTFFPGSPSLAVGILGVGTKSGATDYHALSGMVQKNLPWGGYVAAGGYYGLGSDTVWSSSDGTVNRGGFLGAITSPDLEVNLPGLKKLVLVADVQTGNNVFGAGGPGVYITFNDSVDLLTGPVFFFDKDLQPGHSSWMWTLQLDIDVTLLAPMPK